VLAILDIGPRGGIYGEEDETMSTKQSHSEHVTFAKPETDVVVLLLAEFERLTDAAEELEALRAYDDAKRRLESGEDEMIPAAFANRLIDGENPVRVWREFRGLKVKELAAQAGISAPHLSQIEKGERDGKMSTMRNLADCLGIGLDDLA
jgi:DNA-binding XRE family transcriptional regulator